MPQTALPHVHVVVQRCLLMMVMSQFVRSVCTWGLKAWLLLVVVVAAAAQIQKLLVAAISVLHGKLVWSTSFTDFSWLTSYLFCNTYVV